MSTYKMHTYTITSDRGAESVYRAATIGEGLDAHGRAAGCLGHNAWCEEFGLPYDCWTTDRATFDAGGVALLVVESEA